jgi:uncharacterized protein YndB with AHSA1/START domain
MTMEPAPRHFERTIVIHARPARVLRAFIDHADLAVWWQVARSVALTKPLGTYVVDWGVAETHDEVLGPLGGAFQGTVMEYREERELFVADAHWLPPRGLPLGPMALEVVCTAEGRGGITNLTVRQSAGESSEEEEARWTRYFEVISAGWTHALDALQRHLEAETYRK